ncbi:MAG: 3-keto-disaccharide hydrolase [Thermoguttaceae bacterium]
MTLLTASAAQAQIFPRVANFCYPFGAPECRMEGVYDGQYCAGYAPNYSYVGTRRSIFNGEDLTGWTNAKGEAPGSGWKINDGVICREEGGGDLYLEGKYENFILEFEFKISDKGNSGVKYRSWSTDGWGLGCEYQIFDDIVDSKSPQRDLSGSLYDVLPPREGAATIKKGEFNKGKIIVIGDHIEHYLNDELVVSVDVGSEEWNEAKEKSKFKDTPEFGTTKVGRIFLQDHGDKVWFKNLYLTELEPEGVITSDSYFLCR